MKTVYYSIRNFLLYQSIPISFPSKYIDILKTCTDHEIIRKTLTEAVLDSSGLALIGDPIGWSYITEAQKMTKKSAELYGYIVYLKKSWL